MNMRNTVLTYIDRFRHDRRQRLVLGSVLLILATIVSLTVYWQLRLSGIAMTNETYCGYEEHAHTEECYEYTLVCGYEEGEAENPEITHVHTDECYLKESILICELEEGEEHTHDESCFETQLVLICGQEEATVHVHTEECYENTLICELEEHVHTVDCLVNLEADIETAVDWEATLPARTGDLRTDIVNIAYSQIGYTESTANYTLAEDGITHMGYTRYGAWYGGLYYGSEYSDWDSMFVAFCLDYAGIAEEFTYNSGAYAWSVELSELGYYQTADAYTPVAGDVAFIDTDLDGRADITAIVVAIDESALTVIQGNYADTVALVEYPLGDSILGFANVTYTVEETEDEEITLDESDEIITEEIEELDVSAEDLASLEFVGEDYIISVSYGEDAGLPDGTELVAYEYAQDSENFLARYEEAAELYGWDDSDESDPYHGFRLFNIGLYYEGAEIEPAAAVTVTVTYTGETDAASVSVTHFGDTQTETLDATLDQGTDSQSVTFTADGFSEYGIMLMANTTSPTINEVYDTKKLYVEIVNNIASTGKLEAKLYYLDSDDARVYVTDGSGNDYISSFTGTDSVEYTVTYTWYRSKEPYLATDSTGPATAPTMGKIGTIDNYNYLVSTASSFAPTTFDQNYLTVGAYVFYYYYASVTITNTSTKATTTYDIADNSGIVYASVNATDDLNGAASYVKIEKSSDGKTLTAVLYDENGSEYTNTNNNITYTYTWYKSQTYEATDDLTKVSADDAPYANTLLVGNTYKSYKAVSGAVTSADGTSSTLTLGSDDSFYFYYVVVTLSYNPQYYDLTTPYNAYAKGYGDKAYAELIVDSTSNSCTAAIIDDLSSSGTFKAVLYNSNGDVVSDNLSYKWYKADNNGKGYLVSTTITNSSSVYSDLTNAPTVGGADYKVTSSSTSSTINVVEDGGGLCYYYVEITYNNKPYTSAAKYVQYSDQIENGGFEYGFTNNTNNQINQNSVPYWSTTNFMWSENHGLYKGYRSIEFIHYADVNDSSVGSSALSTTTFSVAYTKAGADAGNYFAEINATEPSTLYQSVLTDPNTTLYWYLYHQSRNNGAPNSSYDTSYSDYDNVYTEDEINALIDTYEINNSVTLSYSVKYKEKSDSMYVIIMSDSDAELLLAEVDKGYYDSQQDAVDAVVEYIKTSNNYTANGNVVDGDENGKIEGCYSGTFILQDETTTVKVTLWQITTTTVKTAVIFDDPTFDASEIFTANSGWAKSTVTSNGVTTTYYYTETDWIQYSGSYTVPPNQYLTRFFFASNGGSSAANLIDEIRFSSEITYTIDYYVWDFSSETYVRQSATETGSVPYDATNPETVPAKLLDTTFADCKQVGSVTGTKTGGESPTSFDDPMTTSLTVKPTNYYLSIYLASSDVALKKVDANTSEVLSGVQFVMYYEVTDAGSGETTKHYYTLDENKTVSWVDGTPYTLTTDTYGMIDFGSLKDGTYYIEETKPQDGYNTATGTITVVVSGGAVTSVTFINGDSDLFSYALVGSETVITLKNTPGVELPETGGVSLPVAYAVGSLMILASAIGLVVRRKKI